MTPEERWLGSLWPTVRAGLPQPPALVVELGCGPQGGFVPMLRAAGYDGTGVDPEAPPGPEYAQAEFEDYDLGRPADAIVACVSLHHVADLGAALGKIESALRPGGALVVVEWARERFDEGTARWCFERLAEPDGDHGWLAELRAGWQDSGQPWDEWIQSWAAAERLHSGHGILAELDRRFDARPASYGPYFFPDLAGTSEADEQAAIDAGRISANRIQYLGRRRQGR
jgi:SAM-dependent methyltransferase